ncbi:hypothetical protein WN944_018791 [Citrus x changshan-huyou]|uniref:Uncharacterized protein n=1 Tax=Citrus x changshan-huyou TaxID=2935761 RepID=A0AAP0QDG9_9ROSI
MPHVLIDQDSNSDATILQLGFGDRLGALVDTMNAPKDLGLDVAKGTVHTEGSVKKTKFLSPIISPGYWTVNAFQVSMLISSFIVDHLFQTATIHLLQFIDFYSPFLFQSGKEGLSLLSDP